MQTEQSKRSQVIDFYFVAKSFKNLRVSLSNA